MVNGKLIRSERKRLGLTQVELGRLVGVGGDIISKYELGKLIPSVPSLQALARVFGMPMDELCSEAA